MPPSSRRLQKHRHRRRLSVVADAPEAPDSSIPQLQNAFAIPEGRASPNCEILSDQRSGSRWGGYSPTYRASLPQSHFYPHVPRPVKPAVATRHAPIPSAQYLTLSSNSPRRLSKPQKLLVVLDLNGTLLHRPAHRAHSGSLNPVTRPGLQVFLNYLFTNFCVMVWSSAQPGNVERMVNAVFSTEQRGKLVAVWARDTLGLSKKDYDRKTVVYKRLNRVWEGSNAVAYPVELEEKDDEIGVPLEAVEKMILEDKGMKWGQRNTLLIDDSAIKAVAQPYNHVELPEFVGSQEQIQRDFALWECMGYLDEAKWADNVSAFVRARPFTVGQKEWKQRGLEVLRMEAKIRAKGMTKGEKRREKIMREKIMREEPERMEVEMAPTRKEVKARVEVMEANPGKTPAEANLSGRNWIREQRAKAPSTADTKMAGTTQAEYTVMMLESDESSADGGVNL